MSLMTAPTTVAKTEPRNLTVTEVELLVTYLRDEAEAQGTLLEALREKEAALVQQDVARLKACLNETLPIVNRLEGLTHRRLRILRSLGMQVGLPADQIQMTTLLEHADPEDRGRLYAALESLREILVAIGAQNRRNQVLIRNGIETNRALVHALFGEGDVNRVYDRGARTYEAPTTRSFVNQEL